MFDEPQLVSIYISPNPIVIIKLIVYFLSTSVEYNGSRLVVDSRILAAWLFVHNVLLLQKLTSVMEDESIYMEPPSCEDDLYFQLEHMTDELFRQDMR